MSENTPLTTISQSLKSFDINSNTGSQSLIDGTTRGPQDDLEMENLSVDEKTLVLEEMFPTMKKFDVDYILNKPGNNFGKAVEELLNHVFFEEEENNGGGKMVQRGVDGFLESNHLGGRKARAKRKRLNRSNPSIITENLQFITATPSSRWDRAREEIDFITERTHLPSQTVSSTYHKSGASLPSAIAALCASKVSNAHLSSTPHSALQAHISELALDFPVLPLSQITALIYLSHPSTASAQELARVLAKSVSNTKIIPHYQARPLSPLSPEKTFQATSSSIPLSTTAQLAATRETAFAKANAASRLSKSKPLMAGAASYYSSVAREASDLLRRHESVAAETLVGSQSKAGEVDLHGVSVQDAVRISKERVETWWENEGREWAREGKAMRGSLKIVTGVGKHSEGGKGRLGPAVVGMLIREGWKVECGEGTVVVVGRARR